MSVIEGIAAEILQDLPDADPVGDNDLLAIGQGPTALRKAKIKDIRSALLGGASNMATATAAAYTAAGYATEQGQAAETAASQLNVALGQVASATLGANNAAALASERADEAEAQADAAEQAAAAATGASGAATTAAASATAAAGNADSKATLANNAATLANTKAALADAKAALADAAAIDAGEAATAANAAAGAVNDALADVGAATSAANSAASNANAKATLADNAAAAAIAAAADAQDVADTIDDALAGKQNTLTGVADVPGLTAALAGKATPADIATASTGDRARANHTGTQAISTVSGLQSALDNLEDLTPSQTVKGRLEESLSLGDNGATVVATDNGAIVAAAFNAQKPAQAVSFGGNLVVQGDHKSVTIARRYKIKNAAPLWSKTIALGSEGLNCGLTLTADAVDGEIFRLGGGVDNENFSAQQKIIGGGYSVQKTGGALVRATPGMPSELGQYFIVDLEIGNITFNGPHLADFSGRYIQNSRIFNVKVGGVCDTIWQGAGHELIFENIDKVGPIDLVSTKPIFDLGDRGTPDAGDALPTTNCEFRNITLDSQGSPNKTSFQLSRAKRTRYVGIHHEMTDFKYMWDIKDSYDTVFDNIVMAFLPDGSSYTPTGQAFVGGEKQPSGAVHKYHNSDVLWRGTYEAWKLNWFAAFEMTGKSSVHLQTLRQYYAGTVPLNRATPVWVDKVQHVLSVSEADLVKLNSNEPFGNIIADPTFQDEALAEGYSTGGVGTATLAAISGNMMDPNGKILRVTFSANANGYAYIFIPLSVMAGRRVTAAMIGQISGAGADDSLSWMATADGSSLPNHGRIYSAAGLSLSVGATQVGPSALVIGIANPRASANYDIHMVGACLGDQISLPIPQRKIAKVPYAAGTNPTKAEFDALINAMIAAGVMVSA